MLDPRSEKAHVDDDDRRRSNSADQRLRKMNSLNPARPRILLHGGQMIPKERGRNRQICAIFTSEENEKCVAGGRSLDVSRKKRPREDRAAWYVS